MPKRARNVFIDDEASVDGDDYDSSELDEQESQDGFISNGTQIHLSLEAYYDFSAVEQTNNAREAQWEAGFVERAKQRAARTRRLQSWLDSLAGQPDTDPGHIASTAIPLDEEIWELTVKNQSEIRLVERLNEEYRLLNLKDAELKSTGSSLHWDAEGLPSPLFSFNAHCIEGLPGRLFVVTNNLAIAARSLTPYIADKTVFTYAVRVNLPSDCLLGFHNNMADFLKQNRIPEIRNRQWVRIPSGLYKGDIAMVLDSEPEKLRLLVCPRFDQLAFIENELGSTEARARASAASKSTEVVSKGVKRKRRQRPEAHVLHEDIFHHMPTVGDYHVFEGRSFFERLEVITAHPKALILRPAIRDDELHPFWERDVCGQAILDHVRAARQGSWEPGDQVYILQGQYIGATGTVLELHTSSRTISVELSGASVAEFKWDDVRPFYPVGIWVRIAFGPKKGYSGFIVKVFDGYKGIVGIWSPAGNDALKNGAEETKQYDNQNSKGKKRNGVDNRREREDRFYEQLEELKEKNGCKTEGKYFETKMDFLEAYSQSESLKGSRHPFGPGTVDPSFTLYNDIHKDTKGEWSTTNFLEAAHRSYPQQQGKSAPIPIDRRRVVAGFGSEYNVKYIETGELTNTGKRDSRIGKIAHIVKGSLKGWNGVVSAIDVERGTVTIDLPGRTPSRETLKLEEAVCWSDLNTLMSGKPLAKEFVPADAGIRDPVPGQVTEPARHETPEYSQNVAEPKAIELGEGKFLTELGCLTPYHVHVAFDGFVDEGRLSGRNGWTDKNHWSTAQEPAFDLGVSPEIWISFTDKHRGTKERRLFSPASLKRVPPDAKNQEVVVLKPGPTFGIQGTTKKVSRKHRTATVTTSNGEKDEEYSTEELCRISTASDPFRK